MLKVRYVHLKKAKTFIKDNPILYDLKEFNLQQKFSGRDSQGAWRQDD
jgi:hypothetical protein